MKMKFASALLFLLVACNAAETRDAAPSTAAAQSPATTATAPPKPATPQCQPATDRLCPSDEGASDSSFVVFREQLLQAVEQKNESALVALVDPKIRTSFGEGGGVDEFRRQLAMAELRLWDELAFIVANGGAFVREGEHRSFWAPYVYAKWPERFDAFEHVVAVRENVTLRANANDNAAIVATVDRAILKMVPEERIDEEWRHVRTLDGKDGWVHAREVRSPIGYRAGFSKRSGSWRMDALVAGD